jgi:YjbE family integral membrane protein
LTRAVSALTIERHIPKGSSSRRSIHRAGAVIVNTSEALLRSLQQPSANKTFAVKTSQAHSFSSHCLTRMEICMDLFGSNLLAGLLAIILLDLVLAGDNAIVIAMAACSLPKALQKRAVFWGSFGAIAVRVLLTAIVVYLLELPGLMLVGGLFLLPIAWKLLRQNAEIEHEIGAEANFWDVLRTIIVADALMGMDNVLAIAGASGGHLGLVVLGLLISVPLVMWGSTMILKLIERFPAIIYIGAAAIAWTAARMIADDHLVAAWFDAHNWASYAMDILLVGGLCAGGWLMQQHRKCISPP